MLKNNLIFITSKIFAGVLLAAAAAFIIIFASDRNLPFLSEDEPDYSAYPTESESTSEAVSESSEEPSSVPPVTSEEPSQSTDDFEAALKAFEQTAPTLPSYDVFDSEKHIIKLVDTSSYKGISDGAVSLKMGYLIVEKDGETHIYTPSGSDIASITEGFSLTNLRDLDGHPLFISESGRYYVLSESGTLVMSNYNDKSDNRGFTCEYPRYLGVQNKDIYRFRGDNGLFGYRTSAFVVISPLFKEAFAFGDEGVACVLLKNYLGESLIFYNNKSVTVNMDYYPPTSRDENALGYFYFDDGLIRVRRINGDKTSDELLVDSSANPIALPSDYDIVAYSDSRILLKKNERYGYMTSRLEWITLPEFSHANPFYEGLAAVCDQNGRYGMIDRNGETVIPFVFDYVSNCSDGLVLAYKKDVGWKLFAKLHTDDKP